MRALDVTSMLPAQAFVETALLAEASVSHDIRVFTFATPDPTKPLGLVTCEFILAGGGKGLPHKSVVAATHRTVRLPSRGSDRQGEYGIQDDMYGCDERIRDSLQTAW
jgi:hypothetical protein